MRTDILRSDPDASLGGRCIEGRRLWRIVLPPRIAWAPFGTHRRFAQGASRTASQAQAHAHPGDESTLTGRRGRVRALTPTCGHRSTNPRNPPADRALIAGPNVTRYA